MRAEGLLPPAGKSRLVGASVGQGLAGGCHGAAPGQGSSATHTSLTCCLPLQQFVVVASLGCFGTMRGKTVLDVTGEFLSILCSLSFFAALKLYWNSLQRCFRSTGLGAVGRSGGSPAGTPVHGGKCGLNVL